MSGDDAAPVPMAEDWSDWVEPEPPAPPPADANAALAVLEAMGDATRAAEMAAYHKAPRRYLGVMVPEIDALVRDWRAGFDHMGAGMPARLALADGLWQTDVHEARIAAARLLTQARIRDDAGVWQMFCAWVPDFDAWAIADHACKAGERRLMADLTRLEVLESWTQSPAIWTRRAALVTTLPLTKLTHPKPPEVAARARVLGWAAGYVDDHEWFIQKAVAWWLRDLSKHDAAPVRAFLAEYGPRMKGFARREAGKYLKS